MLLKNDEGILCKVKGKNPTNLKQYLKRKHNEDYKRVLEKEDLKCHKKTQTSVAKAKCKQMTIANMLQISLFQKESKKYKYITTKLAVFIGTVSVPYNLVENFEFTDLFLELEP